MSWPFRLGMVVDMVEVECFVDLLEYLGLVVMKLTLFLMFALIQKIEELW